MIDARCCLVTGLGGSRMDFVAGWLGCLPGFIDNNWSINPVTGASNGDQKQIKNLDNNKNILLDDYLKDNLKINLVPGGKLCYVGGLHGWNLNHQIRDYSSVQILYIDIDNAEPSTILWEFFVKTYLRKKDRFTLYNTNPNNKQDLEDMMQNLIELFNNNMLPKFRHEKSIVLDYTKLFVENGSRYLADCLEIVVDDIYHDFYNSNLQYASSPDEINYIGHIWKKSDYF